MMRSLSTSAFGQPRLTKEIFGADLDSVVTSDIRTFETAGEGDAAFYSISHGAVSLFHAKPAMTGRSIRRAIAAAIIGATPSSIPIAVT